MTSTETARAILWYIVLTAVLAVGLSSCSSAPLPHPPRPTPDMTPMQQMAWLKEEARREGYKLPASPYRMTLPYYIPYCCHP